MGIDLLAKFSVTKKVEPADGKEHFDAFLASDEKIELSYSHKRDRIVFTDRKIIAFDVQGLTGSKKEFRIFPYSKISSFSVETSGFFDADSDFKIWVSGVGVFSVKFAERIDIKELGAFLSNKIV